MDEAQKNTDVEAEKKADQGLDEYQQKLQTARTKKNLIVDVKDTSRKHSHRRFNKKLAGKILTLESDKLPIAFTFFACVLLSIPVIFHIPVLLKILLAVLLCIFSYSITRILFKKKTHATLFSILSLSIGIPSILITDNSKGAYNIFAILLIFFGAFLVSFVQKHIRFVQNFITILMLFIFSYFSFTWIEIYDLGILDYYLIYIFILLFTFMIPFFFKIRFQNKIICASILNLIVFLVFYVGFNSLSFSPMKLALFFFTTFISSLLTALLQKNNVDSLINSLAFTSLKIFMAFLGITATLTVSILF